jgi:hypothetical protein
MEGGTAVSSETAVKAIHPVYVDGPLKGQDFPVSDSWQRVQTVDLDVMLDYAADPSSPIDPSRAIVTYTLRKFAFHSGGNVAALWLACSEPGEPDAEVLADLLLSDAAKAARV